MRKHGHSPDARCRWRFAGVFLLCSLAPTFAGEEAALMQKGEAAYRRGDVEDAVKWYRAAADVGYAPAQSRLAFVLDHADENEEAASWYAKAAAQGYAEGQFGYARMLAVGEGVARDTGQALRWMKAAAVQDFAPALSSLARWLEGGIHGVPADVPGAVRYWIRAAELGDTFAMQRLAVGYRKGELGLVPDEGKAREWETRLRNATAPTGDKRRE